MLEMQPYASPVHPANVVVFVSLDVLVKIADIQKERRALAVVQVGQEAVLNEPPQLPFTHAEIFSGLPGADQAKTGDGGKRS